MRTLGWIGVVCGSWFALIGVGDVWLASMARDGFIKRGEIATSRDAFTMYTVVGVFYLCVGLVLLVASLVVIRRLRLATRLWAVANLGVAAAMCTTHFIWGLGALHEALVFATLAAVGLYLQRWHCAEITTA